MGVSQQVVEWLRTNGHEAVHLRDEGLQRLPNGEIFQKAGREQRIVLTFDLDFGEILAASGGQIISVILFRPRNTRANVTVHGFLASFAQGVGSREESDPVRSGPHFFVRNRPAKGEAAADEKIRTGFCSTAWAGTIAWTGWLRSLRSQSPPCRRAGQDACSAGRLA